MELKEVFEPIVNFLKNFQRKEKEVLSKNKAKERLQLVLMQDRASVSPDFFEMMKKEIIEVIKKYIEIDEETLEVQLTRGFEGEDGTGPALYANIPIKNIKPVAKKVEIKEDEEVEEPTAEDLANTIIDEIKTVAEEKQSSGKKNKKNKKGNNIQKVEEKVIDDVVEEINDNVDEATEIVEEQVNEVVEEVAEAKEVVVDTIEEVEETKTNFKEKLTGVKTGVQDTFSKVRTSAKEGFEKIKSKVKAKN